PVTVHSFEIGQPHLIAAAELPGGELTAPVIDLDATVVCSSGTYVRALARDLGEALGVGGHLTALRRTRVGPFDVDEAVTNEGLASGTVSTSELVAASQAASRLFPVLALDEGQTV